MPRIARYAQALGLTTFQSKHLQSREDSPSICHSYGMNFQDNGFYFQNSLSSDPFTLVEQFEGCQPDVAFNVLVDPSGDQSLCTNTELTPENTDMLSTCPLLKNQLVSGNWSIIIISNNGDGEPLAAQRDFKLSVTPQLTSTVTPTIIATQVTTPIVNSTITTTSTEVALIPAKTVSIPSATVTPTTTVTPRTVTSTSTKALLTINVPTYTIDVTQITVTKTATCKLPTRPAKYDGRAVIMPTVGPVADLIESIGLDFRRELARERFLQERAERLALVERAPDPQPLWVTESNTNKWGTITAISTASPIVATYTSELITVVTQTPPPVTVPYGVVTAKKVTVTAPTPTKIATKNILATVTTVTKTIDYRYTITSTTTPQAVKDACISAGGILH
ncbi:hypothetical protein BU23DRAFT_596376 [Bimuria novae-zelandiae CBS 107.79]|uniref:Uncharacterized protein n=1 Tax=Bimuria novae-zelandiae CBS 107.79 TaxID=1447943 RepID=A0A6A5VJQ3_9PLEO|nr:hypothetical protein BU23DRAFT_596376 [Bimuria novae-zelandiae CBS 107.79]